MIDLGTGNNNKINWAMEDKQELIDIIVSQTSVDSMVTKLMTTFLQESELH